MNGMESQILQWLRDYLPATPATLIGPGDDAALLDWSDTDASAVTDLVHAPLWGLIRSARSEHLDRVLRLVDLDASDVSATDVASVLSADTEPELAWRYGVALAARLQSAGSDPTSLSVPEGPSP